MAIGLVGSTSLAKQGPAVSTTLSLSYPLVAGNRRALYAVVMSDKEVGNGTITGCTFNTVAMTAIAAEVGYTNYVKVMAFYIDGITNLQGNYTIEATFSNSDTAQSLLVFAVENVAQGGPLDADTAIQTNGQSLTSPAMNVNNNSWGFVGGGHDYNVSGLDVDEAGQTALGVQTFTNAIMGSGYKGSLSAGTTTMFLDVDPDPAPNRWAMVAWTIDEDNDDETQSGGLQSLIWM